MFFLNSFYDINFCWREYKQQNMLVALLRVLAVDDFVSITWSYVLTKTDDLVFWTMFMTIRRHASLPERLRVAETDFNGVVANHAN